MSTARIIKQDQEIGLYWPTDCGSLRMSHRRNSGIVRSLTILASLTRTKNWWPPYTAQNLDNKFGLPAILRHSINDTSNVACLSLYETGTQRDIFVGVILKSPRKQAVPTHLTTFGANMLFETAQSVKLNQLHFITYIHWCHNVILQQAIRELALKTSQLLTSDGA